MGFDLEKHRKHPASHIGAFTDNPDTWVKVVVDTQGERLGIAKRRFGKQGDRQSLLAYQILDNVIDDELYCDVWVVATPTPTHANIVEQLVEGMPPRVIFLEKPITDNLRDAQRICDLCKYENVVLMVNHTRRFDTQWQYVADIIEKQTYGRLLTMVGNHPSPLLRSGIHLFDLMLWFARMNDNYCFPVKEVFTGSRENWLIAQDAASNDISGTGMLRFTNEDQQDLIGIINAWTQPEYLLFELDLFFERGRLRCYHNGSMVQRQRSVKSKRYKGLKELTWYQPRMRGLSEPTPMANAVKNIVKVVNDHDQPRCLGIDGLDALELVVGAHASIYKGGWVQTPIEGDINGQPALDYKIRSH
jgi:predicted dehydrogenase